MKTIIHNNICQKADVHKLPRTFVTSSRLKVLAIVFINLLVGQILAQTWTTFDSTNSPGNGYDKGVCKLSDGRILVSGGGSTPSKTAKIYNPATGYWSNTGSMLEARSGHKLVQLKNGKVLAVGGPRMYELYDTAAGTWSYADTAIANGRIGHSAVVLPSGVVLITGGFSLEKGYPDRTLTCELYDPSTGTITKTGSNIRFTSYLPNSIQGPAILLNNGKVLMVSTSNYLSEIYDPSSGTWSLADTTELYTNFRCIAMLPNGKVLGVDLDYFGMLYDPTLNKWTYTGFNNFTHNKCDAIVLNNGLVLVVEGKKAELYDYTTGKWTTTTAPPYSISGSAILLNSGKVMYISDNPLTSNNGHAIFSYDCIPSSASIKSTFEDGTELIDSTIFLGVKDFECAILTATKLSQGETVEWYEGNTLLTSFNDTSVKVCPTFTTPYILKVSKGACNTTIKRTIVVEDVRCGYNNGKVKMCHNGNVICVEEVAVQGHLNHGDNLGGCSEPDYQKNTGEMAGDFNHTRHAHFEKELTGSGSEIGFRLFPNPVKSTATIEFLVRKGQFTRIYLADINGRVLKYIYRGTTNTDGIIKIDWAVGDIAPGIYQVICQDGVGIQSIPVIRSVN